MIKWMLLYGMVLISIFACTKNDPIEPGNDPNFKIEANNDGVLSNFNRKVVVFDIDIYAVSKVTDANLLHAANVMAQYLDNDEDGNVDNPAVHNKLKDHNAFLVMWNRSLDLRNFPSGREGQDLGNDETNPSFVSSGKTGRFDASLEEVFHLITHVGYAEAYPAIFGENFESELARAMDIARGGHFESIPDEYPAGSWYRYDDKTCDYPCQLTEYFYWSLTSILGAQENRLAEIEHEWTLNTNEKVEMIDKAIYALLTNPIYALPTVLPDGKYRQ